MEYTPIAPIRNFLSPITPSARITPLERISRDGSGNDAKTEVKGVSFADILKGMMDNVTETANLSKLDAENLALDKIGDYLHNVEINALKAELALSAMISVRNKALEAYNEIMRITL